MFEITLEDEAKLEFDQIKGQITTEELQFLLERAQNEQITAHSYYTPTDQGYCGCFYTTIWIKRNLGQDGLPEGRAQRDELLNEHMGIFYKSPIERLLIEGAVEAGFDPDGVMGTDDEAEAEVEELTFKLFSCQTNPGLNAICGWIVEELAVRGQQ